MLSDSKLPISLHAATESTVAIWHGRTISHAQFIQHVQQVAQTLPAKAFAVNLCEDRYLFLVTFFAVLIKQQTNLLPASKLPAVVKETITDYTDAYVITDDANAQADYFMDAIRLEREKSDAPVKKTSIDADHIAAVVFTSGSTGKPKPNIKTWGSLYQGAMLAIRRFAFVEHDVQAIIATVPPQHMYGLETSIIIPMLAGIATVCAPTFYPADVEAALKSVSGQNVLVTTPIHLKACVDSNIECRNLEFVISATAMMPPELAKKTEQTLHTKLYEIYGASEFGSVATRRSTQKSEWTLYDGMSLEARDDGFYILGPQLRTELAIHDRIEIKDAQHFKLKGRHSELVKIAGKRISLGELNHKLISIAGVVDGVFFVPRAKNGQTSQRLTAFVVAPGLEKQTILNALKKSIDPVFLPRPLWIVDELPRNATGKIPQKEMQSLYKAMCSQ